MRFERFEIWWCHGGNTGIYNGRQQAINLLVEHNSPVLWSTVLASVALCLALGGSFAIAETPRAHKCDDAAAHVDDSQKVGQGLSDKAVDPVRAITACSKAVLKNPEIARFHFQLGRAYWIAKKYKEAIAQLRQAVEMQYAPAAWYLGEAYRQGLGPLKTDLKKADQYHEVARIGGFPSASKSIDPSNNPQASSAPKSKNHRVLTTSDVNLLPLIPTPKKSVWEAGPPDQVPVYDQAVVDTITVALLLLRDHPDYVRPKGWRRIIEWQLEDDRWYFLKKPFVIHGSGGLDVEATKTRDTERVTDGYHPTYIPFFPSEFFPDDQSYASFNETKNELLTVIESDADAMELFKQWMTKRAELLPDTVVMRASINLLSGGFRFLDFGGRVGEPLWKTAAISALKDYAPKQIIMTKMPSIGKGIVTRVALLLPEVFDPFYPKLAEVEKTTYASYWDKPNHPAHIRVEYVMSLLKTELYPLPYNVWTYDESQSERGNLWAADYSIQNGIDPTPEFVLQVNPVKFRLYRADMDAPMTPLAEGSYPRASHSSGR